MGRGHLSPPARPRNILHVEQLAKGTVTSQGVRVERTVNKTIEGARINVALQKSRQKYDRSQAVARRSVSVSELTVNFKNFTPTRKATVLTESVTREMVQASKRLGR